MYRRIIQLLLITSLVGPASLIAADKPSPATPAAQAAQKFPVPLVNEILAGWNGMPWGTKLEAFQAKYPKAEKNSAGRWSTGAGNETFSGIAGQSIYGFNSKGELNLVTFEPVEAERATLRKKLLAAGVLREGKKPDWQRSGVSFVVADLNDGQLVVVVNAGFADPSTKPTTMPKK